MSYRFVYSFRAGPGWHCSITVYKLVWHIPLPSVQWINSSWWTDELPETYRVSWQNKFVKLVHLVDFIRNECTVLSRENSTRERDSDKNVCHLVFITYVARNTLIVVTFLAYFFLSTFWVFRLRCMTGPGSPLATQHVIRRVLVNSQFCVLNYIVPACRSNFAGFLRRINGWASLLCGIYLTQIYATVVIFMYFDI
jgi:hypothetical protein